MTSSIVDKEHIRRMNLHGDGYHHNNHLRDGFGETVRILGKIIGNWENDLMIAIQRSNKEVWGSREESPDIIYSADLGKDTPVLNQIVDQFKFSKIISSRVQTQRPGASVTRHLDDFTNESSSEEKFVRILVTLEDWQPGQTMTFGNTVLNYWEKGHVIYSNYEKIPHSTSNASWNSRSILVITAAVSDETLKFLAFNIGNILI
jgi:hypothetical protein